MSFLGDFTNIFRKCHLTYIEKNCEAGDVMTFIFKCNEKIDWIPGQYGIFSIDNVKKGNRGSCVFSIASVPEEDIILISTHIPDMPSAFKQALLNLKPGDRVTMQGPIGSFCIDDVNRPAIFIAEGVGITPYRALLNEAARSNKDYKGIYLLYNDSNGQYAYKDEIDELAHKSRFIDVKYIEDQQVLEKNIIAFTDKYQNDAVYFLSGSPAMVSSYKEKLKQKGIKVKNIKTNPFMGY